jgi:PD-(D/E)XK nuclease superfamily
MIYSYTQISQYLACPRRYRHRYLQGWVERDTRAAMLFGRAFENALGAFFRRQDSSEVLFREWSAYREAALHYARGDNWDRMLQQGIQLLDRFCQDGRVSVRQPRRHLQIKLVRPLSPQNEFVAYVDAIGALDGGKRMPLCGRNWARSMRSMVSVTSWPNSWRCSSVIEVCRY